MTDEDPKQALERMKRDMAKKKAKLTVPADLLDTAKSYDDKVTLVKILSEKEKQRVVLLFKKMIQSGMEQRDKKRGVR